MLDRSIESMLNKELEVKIINDDVYYHINIGTDLGLRELFYNIAFYLENNNWGSIYPIIMNNFYKGKVKKEDLKSAIKEMNEIKEKLNNIYEKIIDAPGTARVYMNINDSIGNFFEKEINKILETLKLSKKHESNLYIGNYHLEEFRKEVQSITEDEIKKKKTKRFTIYALLYLIIILIIKIKVSPELFLEFAKKATFFIFTALIINIYTYKAKKKILKSNENNEKFGMYIEEITFKEDFASSYIDKLINDIDCEKSIDGLKKTLKLKRIENINEDIKNNQKKENDKKETYYKNYLDLEMYELKNTEIFKTQTFYPEDAVYRVIYCNDYESLYLLTFINK